MPVYCSATKLRREADTNKCILCVFMMVMPVNRLRVNKQKFCGDVGSGGSRALIGGGGGCIFIYSGSARLVSFEINLISKEISRPAPEYMNMHHPFPINTLDPPLDVGDNSKG